LAVKKTSKIQDPRISRPLLYTIFQVMWLMLLTVSHALQQCEKFTYIATRLTTDHSKVQHCHYDATCDVSHVPATPIVVPVVGLLQ